MFKDIFRVDNINHIISIDDNETNIRITNIEDIRSKDKIIRIKDGEYSFCHGTDLFEITIKNDAITSFVLNIKDPDANFILKVTYSKDMMSVNISRYNNTSTSKSFTKHFIISYENKFIKKVDEIISDIYERLVNKNNNVKIQYYINTINDVLNTISKLMRNHPDDPNGELFDRIDKSKIDLTTYGRQKTLKN